MNALIDSTIRQTGFCVFALFTFSVCGLFVVATGV